MTTNLNRSSIENDLTTELEKIVPPGTPLDSTALQKIKKSVDSVLASLQEEPLIDLRYFVGSRQDENHPTKVHIMLIDNHRIREYLLVPKSKDQSSLAVLQLDETQEEFVVMNTSTEETFSIDIFHPGYELVGPPLVTS
jgi:hypothetical protein